MIEDFMSALKTGFIVVAYCGVVLLFTFRRYRKHHQQDPTALVRWLLSPLLLPLKGVGYLLIGVVGFTGIILLVLLRMILPPMDRALSKFIASMKNSEKEMNMLADWILGYLPYLPGGRRDYHRK